LAVLEVNRRDDPLATAASSLLPPGNGYGLPQNDRSAELAIKGCDMMVDSPEKRLDLG
jgi:hypothetical protein